VSDDLRDRIALALAVYAHNDPDVDTIAAREFWDEAEAILVVVVPVLEAADTEAERLAQIADTALAALGRVRALCDDAEASHRPYSRILDVNDVRAALDGPGE